MSSSVLEFIQGQESHSSNWGKFYVKGLPEDCLCKEDYSCYDNHHSYQEWTATVPAGTVFTIFEQSGNKRGTDEFYFSIAITDNSCVAADQARYGEGKITGNFRLIVRADGKVRAPRLMSWWNDLGDKSLAWAEHCSAYINKRGCKEPPALTVPAKLPALEHSDDAPVEPQRNDLVSAVLAAIEKQRLRGIDYALTENLAAGEHIVLANAAPPVARAFADHFEIVERGNGCFTLAPCYGVSTVSLGRITKSEYEDVEWFAVQLDHSFSEFAGEAYGLQKTNFEQEFSGFFVTDIDAVPGHLLAKLGDAA